jgi:signal transduction histidine kinase
MRSDPVLELARRGAVRLAAGGGIALCVASLAQVISGESGGVITLAAAIPTTILATAMLRQKRPNVVALVSMITVFAVVAEAYAALNGMTEYASGIGGEVLVVGLAVLSVFIARERPRLVAAGFLTATLIIVVVSQVALNGVSLEIATDVLVVLSVLGTLMYLVVRVMDSLTISQSRYSDLASVIPVATFEFDVSRVIARLGSLPRINPTSSSADDIYTEMMGLIRLTFTNRTADSMTELFGTWGDFLAGPNLSRAREVAGSMLMSIWRREVTGSGEVTFVCNDGIERDFFFQWALGRVAGRSSPDRLVLASTDVTRLRHAERKLAQQLQKRDQFVASVSHELRTPLTSIMGLTEELVDRPADFAADERNELLQIIATETRDVVDIVEDLLVAARVDSGQLAVNLAPCNLAEEARRVAGLLGSVEVCADTVSARADPVRLRQVLRNLVSNAHRYGGNEIRVRVVAEHGWAVAEVRDTGDPLPDETRLRIFEPYESGAHSQVVGSVGLGLHVARTLSRLMGGEIRYSHDGVEAVFRLELPLDTPSHEQLNVGAGREVEEGSGTGYVTSLDQV